MEIFDLMSERDHEQLVFWNDPDLEYRGIIAIHDTTMGPALGGTRFWNYSSDRDAVVDALRLSRGMTYKAAITGLNLGGGKSVIWGDNRTIDREMIFRAHGRAVDSLGGRYITAEDVGTSPDDMEFVSMETEHVVGLLGRSGDPSPVTAFGVYRGIKASAAVRYGDDSLSGKHVVVQGLGNVGYHLCEDLAAEDARLTVTDIDPGRVQKVVDDFGAEAVAPDAVYDVDADIFAPCALGAVVNDDTIDRLSFDIIAGAANNQLAKGSVHGPALRARDILYAPDYVINAGGLINVYGEINEWSAERSKRKAGDIYNTLLRIFELARAEDMATHTAANKVAERRFRRRDTYSGRGEMMEQLKSTDPAIFDVIVDEARRQAEGLELIASENFVSHAVLEAMGTVLTNKYAEGVPAKRYYGGCEFVDVAEDLARDRSKQLFGADHANVQPHSGAQANMATYFTFLEPGDKILGMDLSHGGHLTHGSSVNFSGRLFDVVSYGVGDDDGLIDYDALRDQARSERPSLIIAGASAYSRVIDFEAFGEIAREVDARLVVDMAHIAGLVATGHHPSPVPHADVVTTTTHKTLRGPRGGLILCGEEHAKGIDKSVFPFMQGGPLMHVIAAKAVAFLEALRPEFTDYSAQVIANAQALGAGLAKHGINLVSGGTDNHLLLVDLRPSHGELTGKEAERALEAAGITVNKNTVPGETRSPFVTSGLRIGTPAVTTRGMRESEMDRIADWIAEILSAPGDDARISRVHDEVLEMCGGFPLYPEFARP